MSVTDSLKSTLSQYATFTGRASQREWTIWYGSIFLVGIVLNVVVRVLGDSALAGIVGLLAGLFFLATFIPTLAVSVRRFHDQDRSGWFVLTFVIAIVGIILCLMPGTPGPNKYGLAPAEQA